MRNWQVSIDGLHGHAASDVEVWGVYLESKFWIMQCEGLLVRLLVVGNGLAVRVHTGARCYIDLANH